MTTKIDANEAVTANVLAAIAAAGISKQDAAGFFGLSPQSLSNKLTGGTWSANQVHSVAKALGLDIDEIGLLFVPPTMTRVVQEKATLGAGPVAQSVRADSSNLDARVIRLPRSEPMPVAA